MKLPDKFNRKAVKTNFDRIEPETWDYLFDREKENGLSSCRTAGWGVRFAWYSTDSLKRWLIDHGYYAKDDFDAEGWPIKSKIGSSLRGLNVTRHIMA